MSCLLPDAKDILLSDWVCPEIVDREEQKKQINDIISSLLLEEKPPLTFVYGPSGSGKTFVIKKMFMDSEIEIKKHLPMFELLYVNCGEFPESLHTLWVYVANKLSKYLPIDSKYFGIKVTTIPLRGWSTNEYIELIKEILKKKKILLFLVVDEVDKLGKKNIEYLTYQIQTINIEQEKYTGLSAVLISNKISLLPSLEKAVFDRFGLKIHFKSYGANDLYQILKIHAKYALKPGTWDDKSLATIAKTMHQTSNSAREAKIILYNLAKNSDGFLNISKLNQALNEAKKDLIKEDIESRPLHHKLALYALIRFIERNNKMASYGKVGLYKYTRYLPTKSNVYNEYKIVCKEFQEEPKAYRTFFEIINDLEKYGLIKIDITSLGRARGITSLIYPAIPADIYKKIIEEAMGVVGYTI